MLFKTQPSAVTLLASCDVADPTFDFLRLSLNKGNDSNSPKVQRTRVMEPRCTYVSSDVEGTLEVDLPGVRRTDLSIEVEGRGLTVIGKRFRRGTVDSEPSAKKLKSDDDDKAHEQATKEPHAVVNDEKEDVVTKVDAEETKETGMDHEKQMNSPEACKSADKSAGPSKEEAQNVEKRRPIAVFKGVYKIHPKIDTENISVGSYEDGVLNLRMPYRKETAPKKIVIA